MRLPLSVVWAPGQERWYLRLIDSCITQLKAQGPSRTCNESKEEVAHRVQRHLHDRRDACLQREFNVRLKDLLRPVTRVTEKQKKFNKVSSLESDGWRMLKRELIDYKTSMITC